MAAKKKTTKVDTSLRQRALEMATSSVFKRDYFGGAGSMMQQLPMQERVGMSDDEALARAKKFYDWMLGA